MNEEELIKKAFQDCFLHMKLKGSQDEKVLLMYSGGMDSVSLLWNLLKHTEQEVYVHSVCLHNSEGRHRAEATAVKNSIEYIQKNSRPFEFSSSVYSWVAKYCGGRDMALALFQAMRVSNGLGKSFSAVYTGDYNVRKEEGAEAYGILNAMTAGKRLRPVWATPFDYLTKKSVDRSKAIYLTMPEELRTMYWSCRKPSEVGDKFVECGTCHACDRQKTMREKLKCQT
jgi:7-cyano-7-deazaguanine synthase in queuosine biosynthesis